MYARIRSYEVPSCAWDHFTRSVHWMQTGALPCDSYCRSKSEASATMRYLDSVTAPWLVWGTISRAQVLVGFLDKSVREHVVQIQRRRKQPLLEQCVLCGPPDLGVHQAHGAIARVD
jgi:cytochrome b